MKFLKLLKKLKNLSTHPTQQMSAVIANKNQVISIGYNKLKTHTASKHKWKYIHCELAAILDNRFADLKGTTIYVYREHRDGSRALSRPCPSCMQTIKLAGIKKIVYNDINGNTKEELC